MRPSHEFGLEQLKSAFGGLRLVVDAEFEASGFAALDSADSQKIALFHFSELLNQVFWIIFSAFSASISACEPAGFFAAAVDLFKQVAHDTDEPGN
jgi:hypothetical protein